MSPLAKGTVVLSALISAESCAGRDIAVFELVSPSGWVISGEDWISSDRALSGKAMFGGIRGRLRRKDETAASETRTS